MNSESTERPLVTFAQIYSPFEIILSDDCSPDGTFKIMQEMVEAYKGPHEFVLNRNEENLGIGGHDKNYSTC